MKIRTLQPNRLYESGTTLLQVLLYMGLVGLILLGVVTLGMQVIEHRTKARTVIDVGEGMRFVAWYLSSTIEQAETVTQPSLGQASSSITLATPETIRIYLDDATIWMQEDTALPIPLTTSLVRATDLSFTHVGTSSTPETIVLSYTLTNAQSSLRWFAEDTQTLQTTIHTKRHDE